MDETGPLNGTSEDCAEAFSIFWKSLPDDLRALIDGHEVYRLSNEALLIRLPAVTNLRRALQHTPTIVTLWREHRADQSLHLVFGAPLKAT